MNKTYNYGKHYIDQDDIQAVVDILNSNYLTQGETIQNFEDVLCVKSGAKFAIVVANGTAALHLTGLALGWKKGDIIITSPLTFVATANSIIYSGATPDFVDIDPISYTIDVNQLEEKIKAYRKANQCVKAIIGVDYAGHPCQWDALYYLSQKYNCQLINDACHSLGAAYKGTTSYLSQYTDATILSFHPVKHITTGEGGAILTNNQFLNETIKIYRVHGITKPEEKINQIGAWYYEIDSLGYNYRITDIQCALGISQLKKLKRFIEKRRKIAQFYDAFFCQKDGFTTPTHNENITHAYHLYPLQIDFNQTGITRQMLFHRLKQNHINCQVHYIPVHCHSYFQKHYGFKFGDFPVSEQFYNREISLPIYPQLEEKDLDYITQTIIQCFKY